MNSPDPRGAARYEDPVKTANAQASQVFCRVAVDSTAPAGRLQSSANTTEALSVKNDPLIGRYVEIRSINGMPYRGVINTIRNQGELGELFELGSPQNPTYQRLVYVVDRPVQIRHLTGDD